VDQIQLQFNVDWEYIDVITTFVRDFIKVPLKNAKRSDVIAVSVAEVLENAVKYSKTKANNRPPTVKMRLVVDHKERRIVFESKNASTRSAAESLKSELRTIRKGTPKQAFMSKVRASLKEADDVSQLGLVRMTWWFPGTRPRWRRTRAHSTSSWTRYRRRTMSRPT
jgi:hypothetical protein